MFEINGKVAIVTGGASGIGLATVKAIQEKGGYAVIADYNELEGKKQAEKLGVPFIKVNVANEEEVKAMVEKTVQLYGRLDILVANAGILRTGSHLEETEKFRPVVEINLMGVYYCDKYAIEQFEKQGTGGSIVNLSSAAGIKGQAGYPLYSMTKWGVRGLTKALAVEYMRKGIRISSVHPGGVQTPMTTTGMTPEQIEIMLEQCKHVQPLGFAQPEDIAHSIIFAIENEQLTGTEVIVDGGYTTL